MSTVDKAWNSVFKPKMGLRSFTPGTTHTNASPNMGGVFERMRAKQGADKGQKGMRDAFSGINASMKTPKNAPKRKMSNRAKTALITAGSAGAGGSAVLGVDAYRKRDKKIQL